MFFFSHPKNMRVLESWRALHTSLFPQSFKAQAIRLKLWEQKCQTDGKEPRNTASTANYLTLKMLTFSKLFNLECWYLSLTHLTAFMLQCWFYGSCIFGGCFVSDQTLINFYILNNMLTWTHQTVNICHFKIISIPIRFEYLYSELKLK